MTLAQSIRDGMIPELLAAEHGRSKGAIRSAAKKLVIEGKLDPDAARWLSKYRDLAADDGDLFADAGDYAPSGT